MDIEPLEPAAGVSRRLCARGSLDLTVYAPAGSCYVQRVAWSARTIQLTHGRPSGPKAAEPDDSEARLARGHRAVRLGPDHHDPGPVANLGLGRTSSPRTPPQLEAEAELGLG